VVNNNHLQFPSANFLLQLLSLNGKSDKKLSMLPLSARGRFPLFNTVVSRRVVVLSGLAGGKGKGKRTTRAQIHNSST